MAVKISPPRQLGEKETLETLTHWKSQVRNYFRRDEFYKVFISSAKKWSPDRANYGLVEETAGLKRTAEDLKEDLIAFLTTLSGFLPHSYLTERITNATYGI